MSSKNFDKTAGQASNTGVFRTGMSGNTGMTGSTGASGNTGVIGNIGVSGSFGITDNTGVPGTTAMAGSTGVMDAISIADTAGSSQNTNENDYNRRGMDQIGLSSGFEKGPTAGNSGSDGSGIYGVAGRTDGSSDPSNSDVAGGWSLSDVKENRNPPRVTNSFQNLSKIK